MPGRETEKGERAVKLWVFKDGRWIKVANRETQLKYGTWAITS